jgi:hypothetical protein
MIKSLVALCLATALTIGLVTVWKAEATPLAEGTAALAVIKSYSTIQKVGCMFGTRRCPAGTKWQCFKHPPQMGTAKTCGCRPC